jgi:hypothetical protein
MLESDFDRRRSKRAIALLAGAGLLTLVIGFIVYRMLHRSTGPHPASVQSVGSARAVAAVPTPKPVPTGVPLQDLPQLAASDSFIRNLAQSLSANPEWTKWLVGERLVQRLTASIDNVAEGRSPNPHLAFLAPKGDFRAREQAKSTTIDPASFRRYDQIAAVVSSLDTKGCVKLYEDTRPLFQDAYRDLGYPDRNFDQTLAKAIHVLLVTPDPSGDVEVREAVKSWKLADPALESLAPAQKQLLRMGPDNVRKIKEKLRDIAEALRLSV